MPLRLLSLAVLLALAASASVSTAAPRVFGEPARTPAASPAIDFRAPAFERLPARTMVFDALATSRLEALQRHNRAMGGKRLQIAIHRNVADEALSVAPITLDWQPLDGGQVGRLTVEARGAVALRLALDLSELPDAAELRIGGQDAEVQAVTVAAARQQLDGEGRFWTPVTAGERADLEIWLPGAQTAAAPRVVAISHFIASPLQGGFTKALGRSGACNIDVVCRAASLGQAFVNAENAVARMVFSDSTGSFTCTGTLLNDTVAATQVPYFFSAHHCIDSPAIANTLLTFWEYETPTCGLLSPGPNRQLSGGADLLWSSESSDALLLRLRGTPPAGSFFAGWDAGTLSAGTPVIGIHHPSGDNKKFSRGSHPGFNTLDVGGGVTGSYARVTWAEGTTEGGSSGSGLFTLVSGQYLLRGGLYGGDASCANSGGADVVGGNRDFYSRLDQVFPNLRVWLAPDQVTAGPTRDYTGNWFVPAEPGWGIQVFPFPGQIFVLFFVYDSAGRPAWYRMQGAWSGVDTASLALERPTLAGAWGNSFNPAAVSFSPVGSATLSFTSATQATLQFNDGAANRTVTLSRLQ